MELGGSLCFSLNVTFEGNIYAFCKCVFLYFCYYLCETWTSWDARHISEWSDNKVLSYLILSYVWTDAIQVYFTLNSWAQRQRSVASSYSDVELANETGSQTLPRQMFNVRCDCVPSWNTIAEFCILGTSDWHLRANLCCASIFIAMVHLCKQGGPFKSSALYLM